MQIPNADPAWDYYSIAETLLSMDEARKELSEILTSEKAENGNLDTDEKILLAILKIEGDCRGIRKAIDSQLVDDSKPSQRSRSEVPRFFCRKSKFKLAFRHPFVAVEAINAPGFN